MATQRSRFRDRVTHGMFCDAASAVARESSPLFRVRASGQCSSLPEKSMFASTAEALSVSKGAIGAATPGPRAAVVHGRQRANSSIDGIEQAGD